jgi:hypothetical protein
MRNWVVVGLAAAAAACLGLAGLSRVCPEALMLGRETEVPMAGFPLGHRAGKAWYFDLRALKLADRADNAPSPAATGERITLLEGGVPLQSGQEHARLDRGEVGFSHWGEVVVFGHPTEGPPDPQRYSLRYRTTPKLVRQISKAVQCGSLPAAVLLSLLCSLAVLRWPGRAAGWAGYLMLAGLAGAILPGVIQSWDEVIIEQDSKTYVRNFMRPPLYPYLIKLCKQEEPTWEQLTAYGPMPAPPPATLFRAVRAQKILFWAAFLAAAVAAGSLTSRPLSALFFYLLFHFDFHLPISDSSVMSEPLAAALLFFLVAGLLVLLRTRCTWLLPLLALFFGCAVLTRSASVFGIVLFACAVLFAAVTGWHRKGALFASLGLAGLVGLTSLGALLLAARADNGYWTLSPLRNYERVAFALQVADEEDVAGMPDPEARCFLRRALELKRQEEQRRLRAGQPLLPFDLNLNCWAAALPAADTMTPHDPELDGWVVTPAAEGQTAPLPRRTLQTQQEKWAYLDALFGRTSDELLARHRGRYWRIVTRSFLVDASRECTRLSLPHLPFLALIGIALGCCLVGRDARALAAAACLAAHLASLAIVSRPEQVVTRYVYFSEWLCLLGFFLAAWSLLRAVAARFRLRGLGEGASAADGGVV